MTKLNQIIALQSGKKTLAKEVQDRIHNLIQKPELFSGFVKTYTPKDLENGEPQPDERKLPQFKVPNLLREMKSSLVEVIDVVATQDFSNCEARADVKIGDQVIIEKCPVTHLLFLEKKIIDLVTLIDHMPLVDPAELWHYDTQSDLFRSSPTQSNKTKKTHKVVEKSPATKEHPAQTELLYEDVCVGQWTVTKFSGGIEATTKKRWIENARRLQDAVKLAREEANTMVITPRKHGEKVFSYIFSEDTVQK